MRTNAISSRHQRGFSLIELMVGVVIGLLTVLVITQVMTLAEGKRRTISTGSDAQINAALAMFTLQRDIEQSGYGATANPAGLGCPVKYQYGSAGTAGSFTLAPTLITAGSSSTVPDSVTVLQANTTGFSTPMLLTGSHSTTDNHFSVSSSLGVAVGNQMIAAPATWNASNWCTLFSVTSNTASADTTLSNANVPHVVSSSGAGQWNQNSLLPAAGYASGGYLVNLGSLVLRTYSISATGNLQSTELSPTTGSFTTPQDLYPQIVNLKALYGKDTGTDGVVDTYESAAPATNADWSKVLSVRVALVARSGQYEKDVVTTAAPQWDLGSVAAVPSGATCNGTHKCVTLGVSQVGTDWQHYRYKVYETIVPLRNVLWSN
jgi:type IV pilus assembly protein PilW